MRTAGALSVLLLCAAATGAAAQEEARSFHVEKEVEAPSSPTGRDYRKALRFTGVEGEATYAEEIGSGEAVKAKPAQRETTREAPPIRLGGGFGIVVVLAVLAFGLWLWMRYGGGGALLARKPEADKAKAEAPLWAAQAAEETSAVEDFFASVLAMSDRGAAMARLLRRSLVEGGAAANVRFARSDTEREAFRRFPAAWEKRGDLGDLLRAAELAHYGGRPVDDDAFARAVATARRLIGGANAGGPRLV